jgi:hypothetical protein
MGNGQSQGRWRWSRPIGKKHHTGNQGGKLDQERERGTVVLIKDFRVDALNRATCKPLCWFQRVDDTFMTWSLGLEKLDNFLLHLHGDGHIQQSLLPGYLCIQDTRWLFQT